MSLKRERALGYAVAGFPILVCGRDKKPLTPRGVHDATTNPDIINGWYDRWPDANPATPPGLTGHVVADQDPGFDPAEYDVAVGGVSHTDLVVLTPRGGRHLWYALAPGEIVPPSASKVAKNVDIRSDASYVLLPPSTTDAGDYVWYHEIGFPPKPFPRASYRTDGFMRAVGQRRERAVAARERIIADDLPASIADAVAWLHSDKCNPAIEFQGGDQRLYDTACMMHSFGLSEHMAMELLSRDYNSLKCFPPFDEGYIQDKVENAYAYATSEFGRMSSAWLPARLKLINHTKQTQLPSGAERIAGRYRVVDRAGMNHIPVPEWLIPDLLPRNAYALLIGPPGTFKSFLALDIAMSIAAGSLEGRQWPVVKEAGPVLFALSEGRAGMSPRVEAWEQRNNGGKQVADFHMADPVPSAGAGEAEWELFCSLMLEQSPEGYVLVVIDTTGRAMQGMNDNSSEDASKFTKLVEFLQRKLNCAVLAIQHTGVHDQSRGRGSIVFSADADTALVLTRQDKRLEVTMAMSKQKDAAEWEHPRVIKMEPIGKSLVVGSAVTRENRATETVAPAIGGRPRAVELFIVEQHVTAELEETKVAYNASKLADNVAHRLGQAGHDVSADTLRKNYLPQLIKAGYKGFERNGNQSRWRYHTDLSKK